MITRTVELVEAGIDYISQSLPTTDKSHARWSNAAADIVLLIAQSGNKLTEGSWRGYDGIFSGGAFFGKREADSHIHVSGGWAGKAFDRLFLETSHYSRLDLQATVRTLPFDAKYAEKAERIANQANQQLPSNRRRQVRFIRSNDGGSTLYIGARTSPVFCRLYNKEAQSPDAVYRSTWRFEVELHNDTATVAANRIYSKRGRTAALCASSVWQAFHERGIHAPYSKADEETVIAPLSHPETDIEKRLKWFRTQVSPCVRFLRSTVPDDILLEALGLADDLPVEPDAQRDGEGHNYGAQC